MGNFKSKGEDNKAKYEEAEKDTPQQPAESPQDILEKQRIL